MQGESLSKLKERAIGLGLPTMASPVRFCTHMMNDVALENGGFCTQNDGFWCRRGGIRRRCIRASGPSAIEGGVEEVRGRRKRTEEADEAKA